MRKMPSEEEHLLFEAILTLQTPESFFARFRVIMERAGEAGDLDL